MSSRIAPWCALALLALPLAAVHATEPELRALDVRGLQVGGVTTLTIDGDHLGTTPRLLLPFAAQQQLKPGATDKKASFDVTLDAKVTPGYYQLRLVSDGGISLPVVIGVDALPQKPASAAVETIPVALHGAVTGSTPTEVKFNGKAGQLVLVEVEAQRFGSKLRPIIHLCGPKRLQLAWAWGQPTLGGDARLEATLPEDGTYTVAVHDAEYAPTAPSYYRLRVGKWDSIDQVFPPIVAKGQPQPLEFLGARAAKSALPALARPGPLALPWPGDGMWSGPRPHLKVSPRIAVVAPSAAGKPQELPAGPVDACGRLLTPFAEDQYLIPVTPKTKIHLEVFAERLGSPLDCALVIRNEKGAEVVRGEDSPGSVDPVLEYAVPDKVTTLLVGVVDGQGRAGPRGIYHLAIEPKLPTAARSGASHLFTPVQRVSLPTGGRMVVPVLLARHGFDGPIEISAAGLPRGITLENTTIPPEAEGALLTLRRDDTPGEAIVTSWQGKGSDGDELIATVQGHPLERLQPWLATEVAIAPITGNHPDFQIDWAELPADFGLVPGLKLPLRVKTTRPDVDKTTVKLTLLTSQPTPLANKQPDTAKALRLEKAVELPVKMADGELSLLVPPTLPAPVYDIAVQAELLGADKKAAAVAYTPVKRIAVRLPVAVKLDGPTRIDVPLDPKKGAATLSLKGTIERREGAKGDVVVTLAGLPAGTSAAPVTVKGEATTFTLTVSIPPTQPAGEISGVHVFGTIAPDPKQPAATVRSRNVDLTLNVITP